MNVNHYFIGSPDLAKPAMIVHSGQHDALDPDALAALMDKWQNPTYPEDSYFTEDQFNAEARAKSMQRAQSPAVLLCLLETVDSVTHPEHAHTFSECMDFRAHRDISPKDPWTYWSEYDAYPFGVLPVIEPLPLPHGWWPVARVNPSGISQMTGWSSGWALYTFATQIGPSQMLMAGYGPGLQTRVTIAAACAFSSLYIGPATTKPFVASQLFPLTFGGQSTNIVVDVTNNDHGIAYARTSDPLPQGIEAPNGLIVCGYIAGPPPSTASAWLQTKSQELDWSSRWRYGDYAAILDKSKIATDKDKAGWTVGGVSDLAVFMVEGLYP